MIIGYDYFGYNFHGTLYDTAIPTVGIDELTLGAGIYDELYISVDTKTSSANEKPQKWDLKNIMDAKFKSNLEAGTLDADGHSITDIQIYRRKYLEEQKWLLVSQFPYDTSYNMYSFVDRLAQNDMTYEYCIVPVSNKIIGDSTVSDPVHVEYEGVFISDLDGNYKIEYDYNIGDVNYNNNTTLINTLNGGYPIAINGNQKYKSGTIDFLPVSLEQKESGGTKVNGKTEAILRENIANFLQKGNAKVIRKENGEILIVVTTDVKTTSKNGSLSDIHSMSFGYTEIGGLDFDTMSKGGLIAKASKSNYTFDEYGEIIWEI